jgi:hypothetical protein
MAENITSLARRPVASLVAEVSGEHLPSYVTREQARAIINAACTQMPPTGARIAAAAALFLESAVAGN